MRGGKRDDRFRARDRDEHQREREEEQQRWHVAAHAPRGPHRIGNEGEARVAERGLALAAQLERVEHREERHREQQPQELRPDERHDVTDSAHP